jgi:outer membrane protein assembly factor BamD
MKPEDRLTLAQDLSSKGKCGQAIRHYEKLLAEFPRPQIAEAAKFNLARCRMEVGEYEVAVTEFNDFMNAYPKSDLIDNAMYMIAVCDLRAAPRSERDQAKTVEALDELNLLLRKYPETDVKSDVERTLGEARSRLAEKEYLSGNLYLRLGDYRSARIYFDFVISNYGDTEFCAAALVGKGAALEHEAKPDEARQAYERVIKDFPSSTWSTKAAQRLTELGGGGDAKTQTSSKE